MTTIAIGQVPPATPGNRHLRARLLVAITAGYGLSYTCRLALGVVKKPLIDQGLFSPADLGLIGSALFFAYAVAKLFNGFVADHVNVRLFIAVGFACSAVCCAALGLSGGLAWAVLFSALNGFFQSFGAPGCIIALAATYSSADRGRAYGIWSTSHSLGEALTFFVLGAAVGAIGWQAGFVGAAAFGLVAAVLALALLPGGRDAIRPSESKSPQERKVLLKAQLAVLKLWPVWLLGLASAASYITRYGINSWGILYLQEARHYGTAAAGTLLMAGNLAAIAGSVALGYISDLLFGGRRPPANLAFGLLEVGGLSIFFLGGSEASLWIGMVIFGLGVGGVNASIGGLFAVDLAPPRCVGAVMGVVGSFSYLGSAVQETISGHLIEGGMQRGPAGIHYDFSGAITFWIGAAILSMLLGLCLWRVGERRPASPHP
jgi:OPA family sugar phosphate sensor protein UhpC-like MFS transporter